MSIRSEIRAALVDGPKTTDELLPLVTSVEGSRPRLSIHMGNLSSEKMVRRCGLSDDGKPIYQLDPKAWPLRENAAPAAAQEGADTAVSTRPAPPKAKTPAAKPDHPATQKTKPAKATKAVKTVKPVKAKRAKSPLFRVTRKAGAAASQPALSLSVKRTINWHVGLQFDGSVFAFEPATGTHQVIDAGIVQQILGMAALLRPAA